MKTQKIFFTGSFIKHLIENEIFLLNIERLKTIKASGAKINNPLIEALSKASLDGGDKWLI